MVKIFCLGRRDEHGFAMPIIAIISTFVMGITFMILQKTMSYSSEVTENLQVLESKYLARTAAAIATVEMRLGKDLDNNKQVGVVLILNDVATLGANVEEEVVGSAIYDLQAASILGGVSIGARVKLHKIPPVTIPLNTSDARGAITARGDVNVNGNIDVDGRDHDMFGNLNGDPGAFGVSTMQTIKRLGAALIGGNGNAPAKSTADCEQNAIWPDPPGFPINPDKAMNVPDGTLKAAAQAGGSFFATEAAFKDKVANEWGGKIPEGIILYLECSINPFEGYEFDYDPVNPKPNLMIVHNETSTTTLKNYHSHLIGLLLADDITHIGANSSVIGAVLTNTIDPKGNQYGNGDADVFFSKEALGNLPGISSDPFARDKYAVKAWETVPTASLKNLPELPKPPEVIK